VREGDSGRRGRETEIVGKEGERVRQCEKREGEGDSGKRGRESDIV
jgi:hypothetical protein